MGELSRHLAISRQACRTSERAATAAQRVEARQDAEITADELVDIARRLHDEANAERDVVLRRLRLESAARIVARAHARQLPG